LASAGENVFPANSGEIGLTNDPTKTTLCGNAIEDVQLLSRSEDAAKFARCCKIDLDSSAQVTSYVSNIPDIACFPETIAKVAVAGKDIVGGIFKGLNPLDWKNYLLPGYNLVKGVWKGISGFFGGDDKNTPKLCIGSVLRFASVTFISKSPIGAISRAASSPSGIGVTQRPCVENAAPRVGSNLADPNSCTCVRDSNVDAMPVNDNGQPIAGATAGAVGTDEYSTGVTAMCERYFPNEGGNEVVACSNCASNGGFWTGIGCIGTNSASFVNSLTTTGVGIAAAVALLCIIYAAFIMQTSRGNPERLKKAREYLNSCLIGLLLIIFSVFILRIIGYDVLRIPFFTP
jgi:hypothetical protein